MAERPRVEEDSFFRVTMLVFSVIVPVMAWVLYIYAAIQPAVWVATAVISVLLSFLGARWLDTHRAVRVVVRVLYILIPAVLLVLSVLMTVLTKLGLSDVEMPFAELMAYAFVYFQIFLNTGLLFMLPVVGFSARHGRTFDLVVMRIYAAAALVLALLLCFYRDGRIGVTFLLDNPYVNAVFCLCAAVLLVCSFGYCPPKNWPFKRAYEAWRAKHPRPVPPPINEEIENGAQTAESSEPSSDDLQP